MLLPPSYAAGAHSEFVTEDEVDGFRFRDLDRSEFGFHSSGKVASFGHPVKPASRFQPMRARQ